MLFPNALDAKVLDNKGDLYGMPLVVPYARITIALTIAVLFQLFLKEFIGQETGLW